MRNLVDVSRLAGEAVGRRKFLSRAALAGFGGAAGILGVPLEAHAATGTTGALGTIIDADEVAQSGNVPRFVSRDVGSPAMNRLGPNTCDYDGSYCVSASGCSTHCAFCDRYCCTSPPGYCYYTNCYCVGCSCCGC